MRFTANNGLFADDRHENLTTMFSASMLEQEDALPCSELHLTVRNRYRFATARKCHPNVGWHVVGAFVVMLKVIGAFRDKFIEKLLQIPARRGRGIFHGDDAATRVWHKEYDDSVPDLMLVDQGLRLARYLVSALAFRSNLQLT
ncbi:MAG: hypothetical protein QOG67_2127 [Verrucomicrobiota bacterium]